MLAIFVMLGARDAKPRSQARATVTLPKPVSGQSAYGLKIISKSDNIACKILHLSGGTLISLSPPHDIDRQMAILPPNGKWLLLNKIEYQVRKNVARQILVNPKADSVFEYGYVASLGHDDYIRLPLYQGEGVYKFLFSDNLEQDRELIEDQAWCSVSIRKANHDAAL